jgi:hypothetical protein
MSGTGSRLAACLASRRACVTCGAGGGYRRTLQEERKFLAIGAARSHPVHLRSSHGRIPSLHALSLAPRTHTMAALMASVTARPSLASRAAVARRPATARVGLCLRTPSCARPRTHACGAAAERALLRRAASAFSRFAVPRCTRLRCALFDAARPAQHRVCVPGQRALRAAHRCALRP